MTNSSGDFAAVRQVFVLSFILLFAEVMAVRWLGMEMGLIRAFPNLTIMVVLVASSAGLAAAAGAAERRFRLPMAAVIAAVICLFAPALFAVQLGLPFMSIKLDGSPTAVAIGLGTLLLLVVALYVLFRELGISLGLAFETLPPLKGYSINLAGSIAGVVAFAAISMFSLPPWTWVIFLTTMCFLAFRSKLVIALGLPLALIAAITTFGSQWSPYSKIDIRPVATDTQQMFGAENYVLNANNHFFHFAVKMLEPEQKKKLESVQSPTLQQMIMQKYHNWLTMPLRFAPKHDKILVLGAGSGNDVAFALDQGAKSVHAVEIDPVIAKIGAERHPNRPYKDPRAVVHTEDARTFLRYSKDKFDLIEFAYLDPGATISSASFLRVDNYVYTVEAMRGALSLLNDDGVVSVTFASGPESVITKRIYQSITAANGSPPVAYIDKDWDSVLFLFGPGIKNQTFPETIGNLRKWPAAGESTATQPATDDWPFLYLTLDSGVFLYLGTLVIAVILPGLLLATAKGGTVSGGEWGNMFFLGQAFMLIETKSITQLSLLFGATWIVSAVVILCVLILAYLATMYVMKFSPKNIHLFYGFLFLALIAEYAFQIPASTTGDPMTMAICASLIMCLPILFGSTIFSMCFRNASSPATFLAANLLGVSIGGITENLCILTGLKNLSLVAIGLYALSYACVVYGSRNGSILENTSCRVSSSSK